MIKYAFYHIRYGILRVAYEDEYVLSVGIVDSIDESDASTRLTDIAYTQIEEYLQGKRKTFHFPYELRGTDFQLKVWKALCDIPYGETRSYKDIAVAIGNPKASRAVGMANHNNPMWVVVPCHRVVGSKGELTGYARGVDLKRELLELERNCSTI